ncbi:MAG: hypothetical protein U0452_12385 [Anaerolineae bacterium]
MHPDDILWNTMVVGMDPLVASLTHSGTALTYLGYAEQGEHDLLNALARAETLIKPMAAGFALAFSTMSTVCTRETSKSIATGLRLKELAEQHQFGTGRLNGVPTAPLD